MTRSARMRGAASGARHLPAALLATMLWTATPAARAEGPFRIGAQSKRAVIVLAPSLSSRDRRKERAAARDLAQYLERITGVPVPLREATDPQTELTLRIGMDAPEVRTDLRLDELTLDGYVIKLLDHANLVIAGGANLGTGFGIYAFLKDVCGVRWFMPGPLGEVVPEKRTIILDGLDIRSEPSVPSVWLRPIHIDNLKARHFHRYHWAGHNLHRLVPPHEYGLTHPEYYPYVDGERRVPLGKRFPWQPCVCNPEVPRLVPIAAQRHFAKQPHSRVFSVGVNDGGGDCLCPVCTATDSVVDGKRVMTARYARFNARCAQTLAKAFPEKLLGFSAYGAIWDPPELERFPDNTYLRLCGRSHVQTALEKWAPKVQHLGIYEYIYGTLILEPRHYPRLLGEYVKTLVNRYHILSFSAEVHPFWPFDAPKYYVLSELLWNADREVDELLADYFSLFYAAAAAPMAAFFDRLETVYRRRDDPHYFFTGYRRGGFAAWRHEDLDYLAPQLAAAERLATTEPVAGRVRIVADAYRHLQCWLQVHIDTERLLRMQPVNVEMIAPALEIARNIDRNLTAKAAWDAKVLDPTHYPGEDYYRFYVPRHYAEPGPLVAVVPRAEDTVATVFATFAAARERVNHAAAQELHALAANEPEGTRLRRLLEAQAHFAARRSQLPEMIEDGSFETPAPAAPPVSDRELQALRWRRSAELPPGFGVWSYTGRPARFVWTDRCAYGGKRAVGIEENEVKAAILRTLPVKPGEYYRVAVQATRVYTGAPPDEDGEPALTIAWQNDNGWIPAPRLTKHAPVPASGAWSELVSWISVPEGATRMVLTLGIGVSQLQHGGTYFDDLSVKRVRP